MPQLAFDLPDNDAPIDLTALFGAEKSAYWLEIGFGGGEHLAWQAANHPEIGLIGAEVFLNGIASLLGHVEEKGLANIRIYAEDVRPLLPRLPPASLSRIFILFPDPWPKTRHAERRFVHHANLDRLAPLMSQGSILRIASDDPTYQEWAQAVMAEREDFADVTQDPRVKPEDWPATRYEAKALSQRRVPMFFSYRRL